MKYIEYFLLLRNCIVCGKKFVMSGWRENFPKNGQGVITETKKEPKVLTVANFRSLERGLQDDV